MTSAPGPAFASPSSSFSSPSHSLMTDVTFVDYVVIYSPPTTTTSWGGGSGGPDTTSSALGSNELFSLQLRLPHHDYLGLPYPAKEVDMFIITNKELANNNNNNNNKTTTTPIHFSVCTCNGVRFNCTCIGTSKGPLVFVYRHYNSVLIGECLLGIKPMVENFNNGSSFDLSAFFNFLLQTPVHSDRAGKLFFGTNELVLNPSIRCGFEQIPDEGFQRLLDVFSIEDIIRIFESLTKEETIVVVTKQVPQLLPLVCDAIRSLLHPFVFQGVFVPNFVSRNDLIGKSFVRSGKLPAIVGVQLSNAASSLDEFKNQVLLVKETKSTIVNIDTGSLEMFDATAFAGSAYGGNNKGSAGSMTSSATSSSFFSPSKHSFLPLHFKRMISERVATAKVNHSKQQKNNVCDIMRAAFCTIWLHIFNDYKTYVTLWSSSQSINKDFGFDCENFLANNCESENFSFLRFVLNTRYFGDFIARAALSGGNVDYAIESFDYLCKLYTASELPPAARTLLVKRFGFNDKVARAVWSKIRHLNAKDYAELFNTKKFKDYIAQLREEVDGEAGGGSGAMGEDSLEAKIENLIKRLDGSNKPPLIYHVPLPASNVAFPSNLVCEFDERGFTMRRMYGHRFSGRLTYLCLCDSLSEDELGALKPPEGSFGFNRTTHEAEIAISISPSSSLSHMDVYHHFGGGKTKLQLAFAGGSSELKASLKSLSSSSSSHDSESSSASTALSSKSLPTPPPLPVKAAKPVSSLACAMKWSQLHSRIAAADVSALLYCLLLEEKRRNSEVASRMRKSNVSRSFTNLEAEGDAVEHLMRRNQELESKLREKSLLLEKAMAAQQTRMTSANVRKTAPLFDNNNELMVARTTSPPPVNAGLPLSSPLATVNKSPYFGDTPSTSSPINFASSTPAVHKTRSFVSPSPSPKSATSSLGSGGEFLMRSQSDGNVSLKASLSEDDLGVVTRKLSDTFVGEEKNGDRGGNDVKPPANSNRPTNQVIYF